MRWSRSEKVKTAVASARLSSSLALNPVLSSFYQLPSVTADRNPNRSYGSRLVLASHPQPHTNRDNRRDPKPSSPNTARNTTIAKSNKKINFAPKVKTDAKASLKADTKAFLKAEAKSIAERKAGILGDHPPGSSPPPVRSSSRASPKAASPLPSAEKKASPTAALISAERIAALRSASGAKAHRRDTANSPHTVTLEDPLQAFSTTDSVTLSTEKKFWNKDEVEQLMRQISLLETFNRQYEDQVTHLESELQLERALDGGEEHHAPSLEVGQDYIHREDYLTNIGLMERKVQRAEHDLRVANQELRELRLASGRRQQVSAADVDSKCAQYAKEMNAAYAQVQPLKRKIQQLERELKAAERAMDSEERVHERQSQIAFEFTTTIHQLEQDTLPPQTTLGLTLT